MLGAWSSISGFVVAALAMTGCGHYPDHENGHATFAETVGPSTGDELAADAGLKPMLIAHRGGSGDYPENTLLAITSAEKSGVGGMWITVQVSSDGIPVLYRPLDLSALTNGSGRINSKTLKQLKELNAGWNFIKADSNPYRRQVVQIPTLEEAIAAIPPSMPLFLDLKQTPAQPLVDAVSAVLVKAAAVERTIVYSTDSEVTALAARSGLEVAESRDVTRQRLLNMALNHRCEPAPSTGRWAGFELHRDVVVTEKFTLGTGVSHADAELWDPGSIECFRSQQSGMKTIGFAVNTENDFRLARKMGLDAVLVDSPRAARRWQ
ncbi:MULTISPECIES: glycerophosphodiester phosphodiesterase family protein [unclassified Mycobacterium]|uniref:glycerophosphodiester phosphodiesterase family protein n=1 Tax=unclassified Mycobacterium TaxID=2642494 RepID=UPI0025707E89|nr:MULTISPECIES: glycerophosphodiester phosphodiesterase family protein [unclassified Mycobacterium]